MADPNTPLLLEILAVETRSVLNYVVNGACPSIVDDVDREAAEVFARSWKAEEKFIGQMIENAAKDGHSVAFEGSYSFISARLSYAQAGHIAVVIPPMIEAEVQALEAIRAKFQKGGRAAQIVDGLIRTKRAAIDEIKASGDAFAAARASKAGGAAKPAAAGKAVKVNTESPWRDANMALNDRLAAARGRAIADQLWAAMAQTDCTACGYDCEGYAKAIASGEEKDLTKCVPGEADTADALKKIVASGGK